MNQELIIKLTSEADDAVPLGTIAEYPPLLYTNLLYLYPGVQWSPKVLNEQIKPYGYGIYEWDWAPTDLPYNKSADDIGLKKHSDEIWRPTFTIRDATEKEISDRTIVEIEKNKRLRNKELRFSDFTQLDDAPDSIKANKEAWAKYRQDLRDLPLQNGFPWDIVWPNPPK